ncbi:CATRA conflict system CASPASE/TPR repeat-associated protein [Kitasatospora sp. NPDC058201]|uniref:CATRA conflict system CASPASE/TPR repeat-associated protein n=1 Tax=unclassified Kitasatospora TaxID=2633591 RepID=UPI00365EFCE2
MTNAGTAPNGRPGPAPQPSGPPGTPSAALDQQCLIGYVFTPADAPGLARMAELWADAVRHWPLTAGPTGTPAVRPGVPPAVPPADLPAADGVLCLAPARPGTPGLHQMLLRRYRDRLCLAVTLSPPHGDWTALYEQWRRAVPGDHPAELGQAVVLTAVTPLAGPPTAPPPATTPSPSAAAAAGALHDAVLAALPGTPPTALAVTPGPLPVFEPPPRGTVSAPRVLAVLCAPGQEAELDGWTWSDGTAALTPLARYLLHAAGLRRLTTALDTRQTRADTVAADLERAIAALHALLDGPSTDDLVPHGRRLLVRTRTELLSLVTLRTRLAQDARDAEIVAHNLRVALGARHTPGQDTTDYGFGADLATAARLAHRAQDGAAWLASVEERTQLIVAAAETAVAEQLRLRSERESRRFEQVTRRNTAIVGSLLMLLAAVQSLQYAVPLPGRLKPAVIALLAALALQLSLTTPPGVPRRTRYSVVALAVTAGTLAWCAEGLGGALLHAAVSPGRSLAVALGAALCATAAELLRRRGRSSRPPGSSTLGP